MTDAPNQGDGGAQRPEPPAARPFADWIREVRRGNLHDELSDAIQEVVQACQVTGKAGTLTLKLKITPSDASVYAHLEVTDDLELKLPKETLPSTVFYADPNANLVRQDPRQQVLGLRDASAPRDEADDDRIGQAR